MFHFCVVYRLLENKRDVTGIFIEVFSKLKDPRINQTKKHRQVHRKTGDL